MRLVVLLVIGALALLVFVLARREKTVAGRVVDCETNAPVVGAGVTVSQRGWGVANGRLVWDKSYLFRGSSDAAGNFTVTYRVGTSADLTARNAGYLDAQQFAEPDGGMVIRMRRTESAPAAKPYEVTHNCRLASECVQTVVEEGVTHIRNVCR